MSPNQENVPGVFSCSSASLELVGHEGRQYDHDLYAGEEKGSGVFLDSLTNRDGGRLLTLHILQPIKRERLKLKTCPH